MRTVYEGFDISNNFEITDKIYEYCKYYEDKSAKPTMEDLVYYEPSTGHRIIFTSNFIKFM